MCGLVLSQPPSDFPELDRLLGAFESERFEKRQTARKELLAHLEQARADEWVYLERLEFPNHPETRHQVEKLLKETFRVRVQAATGEPLANARCDISRLLKGQRDYLQHGPKRIGVYTTSPDGMLFLPPKILDPHRIEQRQLQIEVSCPGYGTAGALLPTPFAGQNVIRFDLPLVKEGSPAHRRSVRGRIVDDDNKPIAGVRVRPKFQQQGGSDFTYREPNRAVSITDLDGTFQFYPVFIAGKKDVEGLLPDKTPFRLDFRAHGVDLPPEKRGINSAEVDAVLPRASQHTFEFEGAPSGAEVLLSYYRPHIRSSSRQFRVGKEAWLIPGGYEARFKGQKYRRFEVTADSPRHLRFELFHEHVSGHILDGLTGKPFTNQASALVFSTWGKRAGRLVDISDEELRALIAEPVEAMPEHPAYEKLAAAYSLLEVAKTDATGSYTLRPSRRISTVVALMPGKLPATHYFYAQFKPGERIPREEVERRRNEAARTRGHGRELEALQFFPAARLRLPVEYAGEAKKLMLWHKFNVPAEAWRPWLRRFEETAYQRMGQMAVSFKSGDSRDFFIPAGVDTEVWFEIHDKEWNDIGFDQPFHLKPGELKLLDKQVLSAPVPVTLRILDPDGQPVAGIQPMKRDARRAKWHLLRQRSDKNGEAEIFAPANTAYQTGVYDDRIPNKKRDALHTPFQVKGPNEVVEIRFTREHMEFLEAAGK